MLAFFLAALVAFIIKRIVFHFLKKWANRTPWKWDNSLVDAVNFPASIILLAILASLIPTFVSIPHRWEVFCSFASRFIATIAMAVFLHKLLLGGHRRFFSSRPFLQTYAGITRIFIFVSVYGVLLLVFLDTSGISITPFIASLGVGSVAVALALQETLSSLFSGIYLLIDKPIRVGDFIKLESGEQGYVENISWRSVRIRMLPNNVVIIPNSKLAGSIIINYYLPDKEISFSVQVTLDYSSNLEQVEKLTLEVAREVMKTVPGGIPHFEPAVRYHTFGPSSINCNVSLRAKEFTEQHLLIHEFIKRLHQKYQQNHIPLPLQTIHLKKEIE